MLIHPGQGRDARRGPPFRVVSPTSGASCQCATQAFATEGDADCYHYPLGHAAPNRTDDLQAEFYREFYLRPVDY